MCVRFLHTKELMTFWNFVMDFPPPPLPLPLAPPISAHIPLATYPLPLPPCSPIYKLIPELKGRSHEVSDLNKFLRESVSSLPMIIQHFYSSPLCLHLTFFSKLKELLHNSYDQRILYLNMFLLSQWSYLSSSPLFLQLTNFSELNGRLQKIYDIRIFLKSVSPLPMI